MDGPITIGVIGGSGLYRMSGVEVLEEIRLSTPFGNPSDAIVVSEIEGARVAFLPRHGGGHVHSPTEVPYRANIYALKMLGVQSILSVSACGSLREELKPGDIVVPDQVFDFTKRRESSFFGNGWVAHVSVADPFCPALSATLVEAVRDAGATVHAGGALITIEGPRFSTKAESRAFRAWGMDVIGMTASPEVFLAREAGMCYATMAHVTDYDVWHETESPVTVEMVVQQLNENLDVAQQAIRLVVRALQHGRGACACERALETALITHPEAVAPEARERLALLTRRFVR